MLIVKFIAALIVTLTLIACGGGGGSSASTDTPTPTPTPSGPTVVQNGSAAVAAAVTGAAP